MGGEGIEGNRVGALRSVKNPVNSTAMSWAWHVRLLIRTARG